MAIAEVGTIERTVVDWYDTKADLTTLIPTSRVFTEDIQSDAPERPYIVVSIDAETDFHTNSGSGESGDLTMSVYEDNLPTALSIRKHIKNGFDRETVSDQFNHVTLCRFSSTAQEQEDDGVWRCDIVFRLMFQEQ